MISDSIVQRKSKLDCPEYAYTSAQMVDELVYNKFMTTINTIEDLARILREHPTWAEALRSLILSQDLLDLPARLDKFIEEQQQFNKEQRQINEELRQFNEEQRQFNKELRQINEEQRDINHSFNQRFNAVEGRLGNLEGGQYERNIRAKALSRCMLVFGFSSAYLALTQDSPTDPRFTQTIERAVTEGVVARDTIGDLYGADLVISANDNRHAVFEVSITADNDDILRARARAEILAQITGGEVTPVIITAHLNNPQRNQAEAENVSVFVVPYP